MLQLKSMFFPQLTLLCDNLVLTSYLRGIYLESWFSLLWGGVQKTSKKRRKQAEEKHRKVKRKKNKEYEESQITTIYIFGFILYYARKHNLKKSCLYHQILFTVFMCCMIIYIILCIHSNDDIHNSNDKYTNCNIIEIYINRLSTTTEIFIALDYLIMMSEKYLYFRKRKKNHLARTFFTHPKEVTGSMYFGNIFRIMCLPKICTKT